jgi:hypothetical protein
MGAGSYRACLLRNAHDPVAGQTNGYFREEIKQKWT